MDIKKLIGEIKSKRHIIRLTFVGDGAVGKTTLIKAIIQKLGEVGGNIINYKPEQIKRTPFFSIDSWQLEGILIQSFDLAGQRIPGAHPLDLIPTQVLSYVDIVIFVFALNEYQSFENLNEWKELIDKALPQDTILPIRILVGNKSDQEKSISNNLIKPLVGDSAVFFNYVETSAVSGEGLDMLLHNIIEAAEKKL